MPKFGNKPQHLVWIRDHLDYPHKDFCLIWPFASVNNGYGVFLLDGKKHYVHRYICEQKKGPPPTPQHHASHSCNRGHEGCANHHHLRWKTRSENLLESSALLGPHKLGADQAREILRLKGIERSALTAKRFGVRECTIRDIWAGRTWKSVSQGTT